MLCKDENFNKRIISRYRELRRGILSEEAITANIREIRDYLGTAVDRNFENGDTVSFRKMIFYRMITGK